MSSFTHETPSRDVQAGVMSEIAFSPIAFHRSRAVLRRELIYFLLWTALACAWIAIRIYSGWARFETLIALQLLLSTQQGFVYSWSKRTPVLRITSQEINYFRSMTASPVFIAFDSILELQRQSDSIFGLSLRNGKMIKLRFEDIEKDDVTRISEELDRSIRAARKKR